jgi:hypothetical protein
LPESQIRMSVQPPRSYTRLGAAVVIAAVVISAAIFTSSALYTTVTRTQTTTTTVFTRSSTATGTSSSSSISSNLTLGSFTYSPDSTVEIDRVTATTSTTQNGTMDVIFQAQFANNGSSSIYYIGGCGSSLSTSIAATSAVLKQDSNGTPCLCDESLMPLKSGQSSLSADPGCWSHYYYELVGHGIIEVNMTLGWSTNSQNFQGTNSTSIQAQFTF